MFSYDGKKRPTIEEIRNHPWMKDGVPMDKIRTNILSELAEKRSQMTADTSRDDVASRGDKMLDLVKQSSVINFRTFNDMTDHDIDVTPGVIWDDLNTFNEEHLEGGLKIEKVDGKHILMTLPGEEGVSQDLVVKVKFLAIPDSERTRVRFIRKRGEIDRWYSMFKDMKDAGMEEVLLAPQQAAY